MEEKPKETQGEQKQPKDESEIEETMEWGMEKIAEIKKRFQQGRKNYNIDPDAYLTMS